MSKKGKKPPRRTTYRCEKCSQPYPTPPQDMICHRVFAGEFVCDKCGEHYKYTGLKEGAACQKRINPGGGYGSSYQFGTVCPGKLVIARCNGQIIQGRRS